MEISHSPEFLGIVTAAVSISARPLTIVFIGTHHRILALPALLLDEVGEGPDGLEYLGRKFAAVDLEAELLLQ